MVKDKKPLNRSSYRSPSNNELTKLVFEWNKTAIDFPRNMCLHELVDIEAERQPDSVAVVFEKKQLTYGELIKRSNQLSNYLKKLGVGPDTLVGLCVERSLDMIIGVLAIQKAGGAYVPLDPAFPLNRIELVLDDARAKILVTEEKQLKMLNTSLAKLVCIDSDWSNISKEKTTPPNSGVKSNNLAYVMYTSGSTGKPKGVQIEHRAAVNFLNSMRKKPGLNSQDTLLAVTTLSFDISVLELFLPLTTGAKVVILPNEKAADGIALIRAVNENQITVLQATPATFRLMLESEWEGNQSLTILCGGEPMPADLARELISKCKELWNMYGPTETTIWSTCSKITDSSHITIGRPIDNTDIYILDKTHKPQPIGVEGELMIGGEGLARGYKNLPELTAEKFIPNPFKDGHRIYRTGDLAMYLEDGSILCLGRLDSQVKLHGFRVELGEIETHLSGIDGIKQSVVILREDRPGHKRLVAYYVGSKEQAPDILRQSLLSVLPEYMVPSAFVRLKHFPLTPNEKIDRKSLPQPERKRPLLAKEYVAPRSQIENKMAECWAKVLDLEIVGIDDNFFDLGGTSLLAARMVTQWQSYHEKEIPLVKVFQHPTISFLSNWLSDRKSDDNLVKLSEIRASRSKADGSMRGAQIPVAIVGMAGRFPGADNLDILWRNLCNGVESISVFEREELGVGIDESLRNDPDYIPARGIIEGAEFFDAAFFGISPLEASVMDPQQRVFLELAHEVMENAGYDPERCSGPVGVYAGVGDNHYYSINLLSNPEIIEQAGKLVVEYGNEKDYIALRVAYVLGLTGPAVSVNTACSTSLVAVDNAIQGLANYDCDMAIAGGIDIHIPQKSGFFYEEGGVFAKDGHCRPFDSEASGTMFCDGAGLVALKRLDDAIAAGDTIYAVICGSATNNNGSRSASFLAPSVDGEAEVVAMAQARAAIPIETIAYIEAHGTGTPIGDPIEVEALTKVFSAKSPKKEFCYIGSLKGNIGHPTNAAGIAGLIKAVLVLYREQIPPTLHFKKPNPKIDFTNSPFKVNDRLVSFPRNNTPRRAAVSSFGFGGTNVHAILEEAPITESSNLSRPLQLISISAKTDTALEAYSQRMANYFSQSDSENFSDAAYTLLQGRKQFSHRKIVVASNKSEAANLLKQPNFNQCANKYCTRRNPPVVFLFGGQGTQYLNMGLSIYQDEPIIRAIVDECCELLRPHLDRDLHEIVYPSPTDHEIARESLQNTFFTQPALFTIQYAIARYFQSIGVNPAMMVGHSIGEFVAATLAGVFELSDALKIVAVRGRLMQSMPNGSMLSVRATADEVAALLPPSIQLAAINAPLLCVITGPSEDITAIQHVLESKEIICRILYTSHAFHSAMMDPILDPLRREFDNIHLNAPDMPFVSTVTGLPITNSQACDPEYWVLHARKTVRFSSAIDWLIKNGHDLFLECGPRNTMCTLTRQHMPPDRPASAIPAMADSHEGNLEWETLLMAVGKLWLNGIDVDWDAFYANEQRKRVPLPTYPFERKRHWVEPIPYNRNNKAVSKTSLPKVIQERAQNQSNSDQGKEIKYQITDTISKRDDRIKTRLIEILTSAWRMDGAKLDSTATFLEQGFDSLSLTQVATAIRKNLGVKVSFSQLMKEYPNVDLLSEYIENKIPGRTLQEESLIQNQAHDNLNNQINLTLSTETDYKQVLRKIEELTYSVSRLTALVEKSVVSDVKQSKQSDVFVESTVPQRGIFFSSRLSDNLSATYNESVTIEIDGTVDLRKIKNAANKLVYRHDALRGSFDESGKMMQITPYRNLNIEVLDYSHLGESAKDKNLKKALLEETATAFSLPKGPLFRCKIILLGSQKAAIVLTGHHTICDGWSLDVLIHDFCVFYSEEISGNQQKLSEIDSYADYVRMVSFRSAKPEFKTAENFWKKKFATGFNALILPTDWPRTGNRTFDAHRKEIRIESDKTQQLHSIAANNGWSFFALLLGAYSILLARISRQSKFVITIPTAEQPTLGQSELVGHCVNMLPFVVQIRPNESVAKFLSSVQEALTTSHEYSIYTMTHIISKLRPTKKMPGISPISAGITSVKKWPPKELPQEGFTIEYDINEKRYESFEWYVTALEDKNELVLRGNYDTTLFKESTIDNWLKYFNEILDDISADQNKDIYKIVKVNPENINNVPEAIFSFTEDDFTSVNKEVSNVSYNEYISKQSQITPISTAKNLEIKLTYLWQRILNIRNIDPDDNFFDLGGNSIAAAQLFAAIEKQLNYSLPLSTLFESPTIAKLVQRMKMRETHSEWRSLVPINPNGSKRPLFLIHGAEGNVLIYRALSKHLGKEQPVYGLQAAGLDGSELKNVDFIKVAINYVEEIKTIQPYGPYLLGGYCLGGTIALEMAHQLQAMGESGSLVVMFENYNIKALQWPLPAMTIWLNSILNGYYHFLNLISARGGRLTFFKEKLKVEIIRMRISAKMAYMRTKNIFSGKDEHLHHVKVGKAFDKALERYEVKPYSGRVVLFLAKRRLLGFKVPKGGWGDIIEDGLEVFTLPINPRGSMIEPYVKDLASMLRKLLY